MSHPRKPSTLSSRELLERIGLGEDQAGNLLDDDEPLEDLRGDLGAALHERYRLLMQPHDFRPGDLVTWKPGLKNHRLPRYDQPAVVIAVHDTPIFDDERDAGTTYFREPRDLALGLIWHEGPGRGDLVTFHFDRRRFQPWQG